MIYPSSTQILCGFIGFHNCLNLVSLYNGEGYVHGIFIEYWFSIHSGVIKHGHWLIHELNLEVYSWNINQHHISINTYVGDFPANLDLIG